MKNTVLQPKQPLTTENPFYNKVMTLSLLQQVGKMTDQPSRSVVRKHLDNAWKECKDEHTLRQGFFSIVFSFGDINNREHNIFKKIGTKNVDNGGSSLRKVFLYCLEWMHDVCRDQFYHFLPVYGEYYNLGANTMYHILWTDRFKGTVKEVYKVNVDIDKLTDYIASVLLDSRISENEKKLWAKWLWHIPTGTRKRKFVVTEKGLKSVQKNYNPDAKVGDLIKRESQKQKETQEKDSWALKCIRMLSAKMGWKVKKHKQNEEFTGYKAFRKPYLLDSEATMFSSQTITHLDKVQLFEWFDKLPSGARFNVQRRLLNKDESTGVLVSRGKWFNTVGTDIAGVYLDWMKEKENAQQALRNISTEEKAKLAKDDPSTLKQMERAAKVNTGANKLIDVVAGYFKGGDKATTNLMAQSILDRIKLEAPVLVCTDISGSMSHRGLNHQGIQFSAMDVARLATTIFLLKNPSDELNDMFIRFDNIAEVITGSQTVQAGGRNKFIPGATTTVDVLTDRTKPFTDNYESIAKWIISRGGTSFQVVAQHLRNWVNADEGIYSEQRKEEICKYPIFLVVSDGDMNGMGNAESTMRAFQQNMLQWFGWNGLVAVWDVKAQSIENSKFANLQNVMYYGGFNEGILNQILVNINDLDIIDVYTPLKSLYESNRYQPVRDLVL